LAVGEDARFLRRLRPLGAVADAGERLREGGLDGRSRLGRAGALWRRRLEVVADLEREAIEEGAHGVRRSSVARVSAVASAEGEEAVLLFEGVEAPPALAQVRAELEREAAREEAPDPRTIGAARAGAPEVLEPRVGFANAGFLGAAQVAMAKAAPADEPFESDGRVGDDDGDAERLAVHVKGLVSHELHEVEEQQLGRDRRLEPAQGREAHGER